MPRPRKPWFRKATGWWMVEIDGQLRKVLMVVKMRGGEHSKDIREYDITAKGLVIGERLKGYSGLITGVPEPLGES